MTVQPTKEIRMCAILDPDDDEETTPLPVAYSAPRGADSGEAPDNWRASILQAAVESGPTLPQPLTQLIIGNGRRERY